jgi:hypothetical protein
MRSSCPRWTCSPLVTLPAEPDEAGGPPPTKFYELRDNLNNPWHPLYTDVKRRHGKANPAKAAVARKVLIAAWHVLALQQPFKPGATRATDPAPASSSIRLAA